MDIRLKTKLAHRLRRIYKDGLTDGWIDDFVWFLEKKKNGFNQQGLSWDQSKVFLITYGDAIRKEGEHPLKTLHHFACQYLKGSISTIHILPFFPYSSDDGFSVKDFYQVNKELGTWDDIENLNGDFELMADLVANHASSVGTWFKQFLMGVGPGKDFFFTPPCDFDLSNVIRPRSSPLLTEYTTKEGSKKVWTTFSADQVDLNYANPEVLKEMLNVFLFYMAKGIRVIRLDAIAFLWKSSGTACMHEAETHEVVRLFRDVMDYCYPGGLLLTETNVPHKENITYFGLGDEAHLIYQFALPPLILHALHTGNGHYLTQWAKELNGPRSGTTYLNFTSSHDGIGVRPLEGIMPEEEKMALIENLKRMGARVTTRQLGNKHVPYEINVSYFDALKGTKYGLDAFQTERFIQSQTLMLSLQGIPAFYFLNLFGIPNYDEGVEKTGVNRTINRRKFNIDELDGLLSDGSVHGLIFEELLRRTRIRSHMPAFSPETQQLVLDFGNNFFGILRKTERMDGSIICLFNFTPHQQELMLPVGLMEFCHDMLSGTSWDPERVELGPYQSMWLVTKYIN
jgi:glycosidase